MKNLKINTMKNALVVSGLSILLFACGSGNDIEKKKADLEKLKAEQSGIKDKIAALEAEIIAADSTFVVDKRRAIAVYKIAPELFRNFIEVQARVDADENVSISAEIPGVVTRIDVKVGDEVSKGQVLAETDNKSMVQGLAELQNALELATTMFNKQKNLWDQKIGTEVQFLAAKNQKEGLEKRAASLQQQIEMTKIKSPINGTVDAIDVKLGQMAAPGLPAIRVVNFENLKVKGEVAESYATKIKKGNPVMIVFPDTHDTIVSVLDHSAKVINPLNRTFNVQVNLDNKKEYHPNMVAVLKIVDYANEKATVIPVNIIQNEENGEFVFLNNGGKAKKVKIKTGKTYNGKAEVLEGLKEGDQVIVKGYIDLNEGEEVKL